MMCRRLGLHVSIVFHLALSCVAQRSAAQLHFTSGFEKNVQISSDHLSIVGADEGTGYDWKRDLESRPEITKTYFLYDGRVPECAFADIVEDPVDESNRVLHLQVNDNDEFDGDKDITRAQFGIMYHEADHFQQCYIRFRMMLHEGYRSFAEATPGSGADTKNFSWLMVHEFWEPGNQWRASIYLEIADHRYYWRLKGHDRIGGDHSWQRENRIVPVPVGEWFDVEIYFKKGPAGRGRLYYAVNGVVVFDVHNESLEHSVDPKPGLRIQTFKIYQGDDVIDFMRKHGTPCQAYYDDFEYWGDFPGGFAK